MANEDADPRQDDANPRREFDLRVACLNRGLSVRAAAREIGVHENSLRRLIRGLGVHPATAKRIADFFEVDVTDVLRDERDPNGAAA